MKMYEEDGLNISCWRQISQMSHLIQHVLKHVHAAPSARKVERCIIYNETCIICCVWQQLPIFPENPSRSMMAGLSRSVLELFRYWLQRILHDNLAIWSSHVACNLACEKRLNEEILAAHNKVVGLPNQFLIF